VSWDFFNAVGEDGNDPVEDIELGSSSIELPGRVEIVRNSKTAIILGGFVSELEQPS